LWGVLFWWAYGFGIRTETVYRPVLVGGDMHTFDDFIYCKIS
jgi:hypothetical protein